MTWKETAAQVAILPQTNIVEIQRELNAYPNAVVDPAIYVEKARLAAKALMSVLDTKKRKVFFNGVQYMSVEDWVLLGKFDGCTAKVESTEYIEIAGHYGFKAIATAIDKAGIIRSKGEAYCLNDEENWSERNKYEWHYKLKAGGTCKENRPASELVWQPNPNKPGKTMPAKERVLVGVEKVPLFQMASKAQTTACAKALRNIFSYVAVLAGCSATPAEEMVGFTPDGHDDIDKPEMNTEESTNNTEQRSIGYQETKAGRVQPAGLDKLKMSMGLTK